MKCVIITGPQQVEIGVVPDPTPSSTEVVLAVAAAGICGTDLHIFRDEFAPSLPVVPGHEFAGTVVAIGKDVFDVMVGDRVAADPNIPCMHCRYCHEGRFNLCLHYAAIGVTRPGASAEYVAVPHQLCVRLADEFDIVEAALVEPLACAVHAFDLLGSQLGKRMAIYGSGTMGLMMLQLAMHSGVRSVDVIDPNPAKLVAAHELGCSSAAAGAAEVDPGGGWDVVIDATGVVAAIQDGLDHVARGGTFLQFGVSRPETTVTLNPFRIYDDEIRILGAVCPLNSFERSAGLLASGVISADVLISDRLPLDQYATALKTFEAGQSRKIVILP